MKRLLVFLMIVVSMLLFAVPTMAVQITGLVYSEELDGEYGTWKPLSNQFTVGDRFFIMVPFRGATVKGERPNRGLGLETLLTLIAPDGTKIYNETSTGLYDVATQTFDPNQASFYVEFIIQNWMPTGKYIIVITICDHLNQTVDSIQSSFDIIAPSQAI